MVIPIATLVRRALAALKIVECAVCFSLLLLSTFILLLF